jgi:hypothetical protein
MRRYRKRLFGHIWHFNLECSRMPRVLKVVERAITHSPASGAICRECVAKARRGCLTLIQGPAARSPVRAPRP